eukprot:7773330-Pyramimonas_sp.AAC.1
MLARAALPMMLWRMALNFPFFIVVASSICSPPNRAARKWIAQCQREVGALIAPEFASNALGEVACVTRVAPQKDRRHR